MALKHFTENFLVFAKIVYIVSILFLFCCKIILLRSWLMIANFLSFEILMSVRQVHHVIISASIFWVRSSASVTKDMN